MGASRAHGAILEQSGRIRIAVAAGVVLLVLGSVFFAGRQSEPAPSNAVPPVAVMGRVTVEVLNGTQRQGAARTATRMLRARGVDVVFLGNADSAEASTRVIARRGDAQRAAYVAALLGMGRVGVEIDTFRRVDVSVILGDDFRPDLGIHP